MWLSHGEPHISPHLPSTHAVASSVWCESVSPQTSKEDLGQFLREAMRFLLKANEQAKKKTFSISRAHNDGTYGSTHTEQHSELLFLMEFPDFAMLL